MAYAPIVGTSAYSPPRVLLGSCSSSSVSREVPVLGETEMRDKPDRETGGRNKCRAPTLRMWARGPTRTLLIADTITTESAHSQAVPKAGLQSPAWAAIKGTSLGFAARPTQACWVARPGSVGWAAKPSMGDDPRNIAGFCSPAYTSMLGKFAANYWPVGFSARLRFSC